MRGRFSSPLFWGSHSPLSALTAVSLIILASNRLAFAIICAGALVWVYGLTALIFSGARKIMPAWGKMVILLFLSALMCGIFVIFMSLLNPMIILGAGFFLILIPPCFLGSGLFDASGKVNPMDVFSRAVLEALLLALVIIAFALIREPLGLGTLSVPGGVQGIVEIFGDPDREGFVPARILSVSGGGLLLLGYGTALFRSFRGKSGGAPQDGFQEEGL